MEKIKNWIVNNRLEAFLLAITLLAGALLRLYRIDEYMTFLGDEGRDVIIVRRLLVDFDPILVGPGTSIGNMYLGPLYYYLIAPFLFLANFSPVGPSVMVALFGIATIFFVWYVSREWFSFSSLSLPAGDNKKILSTEIAKGVNWGAVFAAALYAVSPVVIIYSRSSWNPNIMPFFSLLSIYSIWRFFRGENLKWLLLTAFSLAMALNSHYLALVLFPVAGFFWLLKLILFYKDSKMAALMQRRFFLKNTVLGILIFAFLMSPVVIFDARHGWRNFSAMKVFFTERQTTVSAKPWSSIPNLYPNFEEVNTRLLAGTDMTFGKALSVFLLVASAVFLVNNLRKGVGKDVLYSPYFLLFVWFFTSFIGLGVYKQEIYDHYYGFFFAAPFLLVAGLSQEIFRKMKSSNFVFKTIGYCLLLVAFVILLFVNLANSPLKYPPNRQLQRSEEVARKIVEESQSREFNIAVIAERNYEGAYQYFLEAWGAPLKMIDPQMADDTITDQLFVVCELPEEKCQPTTNEKAGIANFGWSQVSEQWMVDGVWLYKLTHY